MRPSEASAGTSQSPARDLAISSFHSDAPIYSHTGEVLAALNLAIHRTIVSMDELVVRCAPAPLHAANDISSSVGHRVAAL